MNILPVLLVLLSYNNEVPPTQIQKEIETFYHIKIDMAQDKLPANAYYKPRNRYKAQEILYYLEGKYPGKRVIGLTSSDISTPAYGISDYGIFGLGSTTNNVSITSDYRLKGDRLNGRVIKIILHEIGHSYGLQHCHSEEPCFMKAGDHTLKSVDKEQKVMCSSCKKQLKL